MKLVGEPSGHGEGLCVYYFVLMKIRFLPSHRHWEVGVLSMMSTCQRDGTKP
jgi:hypothetical protein